MQRDERTFAYPFVTTPNDPSSQLLTTNRKALTINLDQGKYGTFAEIGAGQEVVRHFFQAGGAAGTVAKTMSAYDMLFSDAIYGKSQRYVSRDRLLAMLEHEYVLLLERLQQTRGTTSQFFVFADTVAAKSFKGNTECHGWMGIRFQAHPLAPPNDVIIHVRMWDKENVLQQQALGIIGVNLVYGAFFYHQDPLKLIDSLADNLGTERVEVDMITFRGPEFASVDNRLMSLHLVRTGLTNAVLYGADRGVLQPSEVFYKRPVLVERGSFNPVTRVNLDMLACAQRAFEREPSVAGKSPIVVMEITLKNLLAAGSLDVDNFLQRVDMISATGHPVLISNYSEYYRLVSYLRRYTKEMIGLALGVNNLAAVFEERYYEDLEGGILESFGRLFRFAVRLYAYPMRRDAFNRYLAFSGHEPTAGEPEDLITGDRVPVAPHLRHLYTHLLDNGCIANLEGYDGDVLGIFSRDVARMLAERAEGWENLVPPAVAALLRGRACPPSAPVQGAG